MIRFKFHVFTIAALFFSFTLGLVIGLSFGGGQLTKQQSKVIDNLQSEINEYRVELDSLKKEASELNTLLSKWENKGEKINDLLINRINHGEFNKQLNKKEINYEIDKTNLKDLELKNLKKIKLLENTYGLEELINQKGENIE